jgi:hypothetical protein
LVQAALDDRFFRVTDFAPDGAFPRHREIKDEVERLVAAIERVNSPETLLAAAMSDPRFMRGSSLAHPQPYSAQSGTRPIAFRQLELLLGHTIAVLDARALWAPSPTDRACRTVHGLYEGVERPRRAVGAWAGHDPGRHRQRSPPGVRRVRAVSSPGGAGVA